MTGIRVNDVKSPIDFYFDFSSPYGYLASEKIEALAARHGRSVDWHPILLGIVFRETGAKSLTEVPLKGNYSRAISPAARSSTASIAFACRRRFRSPRKARRESSSG